MRSAQLRRTVIVGNGGSGKSRIGTSDRGGAGIRGGRSRSYPLAGRRLRTRRDDAAARDLVAAAAAKPAWVIEGVYGWLARVALPATTALIWLDLPWNESRAGLMERGLRGDMTSSDHAALVAWAAEYWTRDNANSYGGHLRLYEGFAGAKLRLTSRSQVEQFVAALPSPPSD